MSRNPLTVFATGAASGIGAATVCALCARGDTVFVADRDEAGAKRVAEELGSGAHAITMDVRDASSVAQAFAAAASIAGKLDAICANAGVTVQERPLEELPEEDLRLVIDINLAGAIRTLSAGLPHLRDGGAIVLTSSTSGIVAHPLAGAYAATKLGLVGLQRSLVAELAPRRIRVNAVCPGAVDTPLVRSTYPVDTDQVIADAAAANPLGRIAQPEDVAEAICFLIDARHVNGVALRVDGGESVCVFP